MWYIQKDVFGSTEELELKNALTHLDIDYIDCDSLDFVKVDPNWMSQSQSPVFRGSVEFVDLVRKKYENTFRVDPPTCITAENYDCTKYYKYWINNLLNEHHFFVPWKILELQCQNYFDYFETEKIFIRPNSGRKIFTGNYITEKWWPRDLETISSLPGNNPGSEDLVLISPFKNIKVEYRVMMHMDLVLSHSYYDGNEGLSVDVDDLYNFCQCSAWAASYYPDEYYTIDVCVLEDGSMKIIELNSLFSAGWYDADYGAIIKHVRDHL